MDGRLPGAGWRSPQALRRSGARKVEGAVVLHGNTDRGG
ncbi:hypothetical protein EPYR_03413 [Erwinia pyrifoliae DSM 12163]|nr:hypothetical protein EPYR_01174 [Erwinia pyrifoliae DSM 12163]CAY75784.1 hypothetical protein EPYR_03404 [Erwinia pyrifoliae DSM 12163]CAY75793.1 hypothetical protein EPYR_03413 [Erwinia pyrifoliae DSM 12163]